MADVQTCVIGAGVIGLAVAAELSTRGHEVVVLERAAIIGSETSARNSEVIHAGIYYPKNSLKAMLCVEGKKLLYAHCARHNVPHAKIGKWIVATSTDQLERLHDIRSRAEANGVTDLVLLDRKACLDREPDLACHGALHSPSTGIVDSHALMLSLQGQLEKNGGVIAFETKVDSIRKSTNGDFELGTVSGKSPYLFSARNLVLCAGLHGDELLRKLQVNKGKKPPATHFAKGNYFKLVGKAPFSRLIYPVPDPGGLGVHLTLDLGGQARFGPDVEWIEAIDYTVDPTRSEKFYSAIRQYWPDLPDGSLEPDYAGIRPKLVRAGEPDADFLVHGSKHSGVEGLTILAGIESPGLTASLALAKYVADRV